MKTTRRGFFGMICGAIAAALTPKPLLALETSPVVSSISNYNTKSRGIVDIHRRANGSIRVIFPDQCYLEAESSDYMRQMLRDQDPNGLMRTLQDHGHGDQIEDVLRILRTA